MLLADEAEAAKSLAFYPQFFFLRQVAPKIKAMMMEKGSTMVGYQPLKEKPNFFR